jgi:hypothetical protein
MACVGNVFSVGDIFICCLPVFATNARDLLYFHVEWPASKSNMHLQNVVGLHRAKAAIGSKF